MKSKLALSAIFLTVLAGGSPAEADDQSTIAAPAADPQNGNPLDLAPEQFFNQDLTVFSPAKKLQKLRNIPSAVYVLTAEDIRRSAAENLIDVFRLVPGIEVARVSSHEFAITSRGFNQVFGNKILLLIDGAPVETPIFNGILWENINIPLDTIERIEFVRGPGAAIWGTRAMNGLINVITKSSFTYPYNRVSAGGGNEHLASVYARTGAVVSDKAAVQTYVKMDKYDGSVDNLGRRLNDEWGIVTGSIRSDLRPDDQDKVRLTASFSARQADFELNVPTLTDQFSENRPGQRDNKRASLGALWDHELANDAQISLEWSNLFEHRNDFLLDLSSYYSELELRHRFHPATWNDLTYGLNFRFYTDQTDGSPTLSFDPENRTLEYYRGFIHDEISLIPKVLTLTLGSRFEQNDQVGFNAMPTARLLWSVSDSLSLWTAVSYTTGSPARVYDDIRLNVASFPEPQSGLPAMVQITGNRNLKAEKLTAYEIGAWFEPLDKLYSSATAYYFRYNDLNDFTLGEPQVAQDPFAGPSLLIPNQYTNGLRADSIGAELTTDWNVTEWFSLGGSYSHLQITANPDDNTNKGLVEDNPRNLFSLRAHFTLAPSLELDSTLRYVDVDRTPSSVFYHYLENDVRIGWNVRQNLEVEAIGRTLLQSRHQESGALLFNTPSSEIQRSVFGRVTYTF